MAAVKLVTDGRRMAALLRSPNGMVGRHLIERAQIFQTAAKNQAPRRTGCLQDSIVKRVEETPAGIQVRVVADTTPCSPTRTSYALFVHEGTKAHPIEASPGKTLAFYWANGPDGPGVYFFKRVKHPGTEPNRFLTDNLWLVVS